MRTSALWLGLGLAAQFPCALIGAESTSIYVSTHGSDSNAGSQSQPIQTLHRAVELVRQSRESQPELTVEVIVEAGEYFISKPLILTQQDSGTEEAKIVYRAAESQAVVLSGAVRPERIGSANQFLGDYPRLSHEATRNIVVYEVSISEDAWVTPSRGASEALQPSSLQLYAHGRLFPQSIYPNSGWLTSESALKIDAEWQGVGSDSGQFIHGFPNKDWQDEFQPLKNANWAQWREGSRFRIQNCLSELDQPGEWYLDAENRRLLWWPDETSDSDLRVTGLETLVSMYDTEFIEFQGFTLEGARVQAVEIAGGYRCGIRQTVARCCGNVGIHVFHGHEHLVSNCEVYSTGASGIRIEGGNRSGRVPADHQCVENEVHHCSTQNLAGHAAIAIFGVGVTVEQNHVHHQPDWAISVWGDDNLVKSNHLHHVCTQTSDSGAIYMSDDQGYQGNVITQNHIHSVGEHDTRNVYGIYLNQGTSSNEVSANLIHDVPRAIVIRGGSNNRLAGNIIHDCWVGVQFAWINSSRDNSLASNAIEAEHALLVSDSVPVALIQDRNITDLSSVFINARRGDFRWKDEPIAKSLGLDQWQYSQIFSADPYYVRAIPRAGSDR